ncbi:dim gamma-tubulin 6 [Rhipicephalus microplus]|uniref:dim gamma-tubulin 6 n=1 Tax=Rhipicephalus microplus TaxID=6941 RepID=UPI003F6A8DB5
MISTLKHHRRSKSVPVLTRSKLDDTFVPFESGRRKEEIFLLLKNLELLNIKSSSGTAYFVNDFFGKHTSVTVREVIYGLLNAYDKKEARKFMKNVWPIKPRQGEQDFRDAIVSWLSTLKDKHPEAAFLQVRNLHILLPAGTPRNLLFLTELSALVLERKLNEEVDLAGDAVPPAAIKSATRKNTCTATALQAQLISDEEQCRKIERKINEWKSLLSDLLQELGIPAKNEMPDDDLTEELQLTLDSQAAKYKEVMMAVNEAIRWLRRRDSVVPTDLIGDLQECIEFSKHFFNDDEQKARVKKHSSLSRVCTTWESLNDCLGKIHAMRQALEEIAAVFRTLYHRPWESKHSDDEIPDESVDSITKDLVRRFIPDDPEERL